MKLTFKAPSLALSTLLLAFASTVSAIEQSIPLSQSKGGTLYLEATLESNVNASFLLDTGSSLLTLNQDTFDALTRNQKLLAMRSGPEERLRAEHARAVQLRELGGGDIREAGVEHRGVGLDGCARGGGEER